MKIIKKKFKTAQKKIYLQRVNQLYDTIKTCLQKKSLILKKNEIKITEALGDYKAPQLTIKTRNNELLAKFNPSGASTLLSEGVIDINGSVDKGYFFYMLKNNPQTFFKIDKDGWYWTEDRITRKQYFIQPPQILKMITFVSDYEF